MSSSSHERLVKGYLKPSQHNFIVNYSEVYNLSESAAVNQAVKALKESLPKETLARIMKNQSKNSY